MTGGPRPGVARRGTLAAGVALLVAAIAHAGTGGTVEPAAAGWALLALLGPACWVARRERGWATLAAVQFTGQQVAHATFVVGGGMAADRPELAGLLPADLMFYAHLLAAAAAACWLRVGERRAFAGLRRVLEVCRQLAAGPPAPAVLGATRQVFAGCRPVELLLGCCVPRRGPPPRTA